MTTTPTIPIGSISNSHADPKLYHLVEKLVRKVIETAPANINSTNNNNKAASRGDHKEENLIVNPLNHLDHVVTLLRTHHREYLRKDVQRVKAQVESTMRQILADTNAVESALSSQRHQPEQCHLGVHQSTRKRKSFEKKKSSSQYDDEQKERLYDEGAIAHDIRQQAHMESPTAANLNAMLRHRYQTMTNKRQNFDEEIDDREVCNVLQTKAISVGIGAGVSPTVKSKVVKVVKRSISKSASCSESLRENRKTSEPGYLVPVKRPTERYSDLGGIDTVIKELRQLIEYPLMRPELYRHLGIDPPRGVLLRGPPGVGKTVLANAVAGELGVPFFRISAPELVSGMSGESESRIRDLFQVASEMAPSLLFLDEIDAIAPKRDDSGSSRGMEKRMVAQLLTCLDMVAPKNNRGQAAVMVLAATNRPDALDAALRRAGRFDKEILMGVPDEDTREHILRTMTKNMRLSGDLDFKLLARKTPGFVGADVHSLAKEAAVLAISRICRDVPLEGYDMPLNETRPTADCVVPLTGDQMEDLFVTMDDFISAVPLVQPSSKREGFATVPDVSWTDIGALSSIREELTFSVLEPIRSPEKFKALGIPLPTGVLLYGPPGCGKTLLAKAVANESGANFISVKGPELLDKYVGESERAVRLVFERARSSNPCIVFFDELDSLVPKRGSDSSGSGVSERVVNQLLTELDGLDSRRSVFVIAATNRPELIDPAMLRPGRLDKLQYVPLPTPEDRVSILEALASKISLDSDVNLQIIGKSTRANGFSGADCASLLREAGLAALKESSSKENDEYSALRIHTRHFDTAFTAVMPSVSKKDQSRYDRIRDRIASTRCRGIEDTDC